MAQEKEMILEMVKDNKITVDDAVKLLNAINKKNNSLSKFDFEDGFYKVSYAVDKFSKDLKNKINNLYKNDGNKFKENTQVFFHKTEEFFDEFSKSIKDFFKMNVSQNNTMNNQNQESSKDNYINNTFEINNQNIDNHNNS